MLRRLKKADFEPYLNETFVIHLDDDETLQAMLIEAADLGDSYTPAGPFSRLPFSLLFRVPGDVALPQRIYRMSNPELGSLDLFLVPLQPDDEGGRFEAIFS